MKLMGIPKLLAAAADASPAAPGACAALCAELKDGCWEDADAVSAAFPNGKWSKERITIRIDDVLDAIVLFNFKRGIAMIDSSNQNVMSRSAATPKRRASQ